MSFQDYLKQDPALQDVMRGVSDLSTGVQGNLQSAINPYQEFMKYVENYYGQPGVEPGPEFGQGVAQGPGIYQPGMRTANPAAAPPPASPEGTPFYLQRPDQLPSQTNATPVGDQGGGQNFGGGIDPYAFPAESAGGGPAPPMQGPTPSSGDPQKNEYEAMVKEYLTKLQQPADFPKPKQLAPIQALAIMMNPDKADFLYQQSVGEDYKNRLAEYQSNEQRQREGLVGAEAMYTRTAELGRRDAERSWFREAAMANAGAPVPPGYQWKNPEQQAIWNQKAAERKQMMQWRQKQIDRPYSGQKPANKYEYLKYLQSEKDRTQGQLLSPGAKETFLLGQHGVGDPRITGMLDDMLSGNDKIEQQIQVVNAMDEDTFQEFINLDGIQQEEVIQQYLQALQSRGMMPGNTAQSPTPAQPVGP